MLFPKVIFHPYFPARVCYHCNRSRECFSQPQLHTMKCYNEEDSCGKILWTATDEAERGCTAMKADGCHKGSPTLERKIVELRVKRNLSSPFKRQNEDYTFCCCNKDYCNAQEPMLGALSVLALTSFTGLFILKLFA